MEQSQLIGSHNGSIPSITVSSLDIQVSDAVSSQLTHFTLYIVLHKKLIIISGKIKSTLNVLPVLLMLLAVYIDVISKQCPQCNYYSYNTYVCAQQPSGGVCFDLEDSLYKPDAPNTSKMHPIKSQMHPKPLQCTYTHTHTDTMYHYTPGTVAIIIIVLWAYTCTPPSGCQAS